MFCTEKLMASLFFLHCSRFMNRKEQWNISFVGNKLQN